MFIKKEVEGVLLDTLLKIIINLDTRALFTSDRAGGFEGKSALGLGLNSYRTFLKDKYSLL